MVIPQRLQKILPFEHRPKTQKQIKDELQSSRPVLILEPKEKKVSQKKASYYPEIYSFGIVYSDIYDRINFYITPYGVTYL